MLIMCRCVAAYYNNFAKYPANEITNFGVTYDPFSVMHYSAYAFSLNQQKTIDFKNKTAVDASGGKTMGQRDQLTDKDISKLNIMYSCK